MSVEKPEADDCGKVALLVRKLIIYGIRRTIAPESTFAGVYGMDNLRQVVPGRVTGKTVIGQRKVAGW